MDDEIIRYGENLSVPMWQCASCGTTGETATPAEATAAMLEHIRAAHPAGALIRPAGSQGEDFAR